MDETMNATEGMEQTSDAFLDGWDDSTAAESTADQPESDGAEQAEAAGAEEGQEGGEAAGQEAGGQQQDSGEGQAQEPQAQGGQAPADVPKLWTLRHLDEEKVVNEQEMTALAQKGLDYDRIRSKYDESKPVMELFTQFARQAGMSVQDYIGHLRTQAKKAAGMNDAEAKRAVELEDREAAVAAKEQQEAAKEAAGKSKTDADARRRADIAEFQKAFPDAAKEPDKIPQEVWADVRSGMSLVTAYAKYSVKQAKSEAQAAEMRAAAEKQNSKNTSRSTGSMKSAGGDKKSKDPFLEGWDS